MSNWFNHVYLRNLYDALDEATASADYQAPFSEILNQSLVLNLEDPAVDQFFKLIGFDPLSKGACFRSIEFALMTWVREHSAGPGTYDPEAVDRLFELQGSPLGLIELDRLFGQMAGVSLSAVVRNTQVLHDPADPGLHGPVCFAMHMDVLSFEMNNMAGRRTYLAMGSTLDHVLAFAGKAVSEQGQRFNTLSALGRDSSEYQAETKAGRAKPSSLLIDKAGKVFLSINVPNRNVGEDYELDWASAKYTRSIATMSSIVAAAPERVGRQIKARHLEDDLGM